MPARPIGSDGGEATRTVWRVSAHVAAPAARRPIEIVAAASRHAPSRCTMAAAAMRGSVRAPPHPPLAAPPVGHRSAGRVRVAGLHVPILDRRPLCRDGIPAHAQRPCARASLSSHDRRSRAHAGALRVTSPPSGSTPRASSGSSARCIWRPRASHAWVVAVAASATARRRQPTAGFVGRAAAFGQANTAWRGRVEGCIGLPRTVTSPAPAALVCSRMWGHREAAAPKLTPQFQNRRRAAVVLQTEHDDGVPPQREPAAPPQKHRRGTAAAAAFGAIERARCRG